MNQLTSNGYDIHLCWVLGHADIQRNERTDRAAKKALNCDVEPCLIPHSDLKPLIATHIKAKWQLEWDESINKLHGIKPSVGKPPQIYTGNRRDQVVLSRCRIGHSWLTHAFLLKGEPAPECIRCQSPLTIEHILLNCVDFMALRQQFYTANSMHELFTKVKQENILAFLSATGLYRLI